MTRPLTPAEESHLRLRLRRLEATSQRFLAEATKNAQTAALAAEYRRVVAAAHRELAEASAVAAERQQAKDSGRALKADLSRARALAQSDAAASTQDLHLAAIVRADIAKERAPWES